ncbi:MAG: DUF5074 domain-containing protein [Crocinitomicaceae bacterium]
MKNLLITGLMVLLFSCKKDDPVVVPEKYDNGLILLNEGLFQQNNASISFYDIQQGESYQQVFQAENNRGLGDTANNFEKYTLGDSTYLIIAVDISSQLEIVHAGSLKSVAQIPVFNGSIAREPRRVLVAGDKAYSCNYDGTVSVVDLNTYKITNTITVGQNPDGMLIVDNRLYVANSGGLNYPVYDSTMSVIDLNTETLISTFETRINSSAMLKDSEGDIYLLSNGNYSDVAPAMLHIDTETNQVLQQFDVSIGGWDLKGEWLYYYDFDLQGIYRFNTLSETFENMQLLDAAGHTTFYGLYILGNDLFTVDANDYVNSSTVRCYDLNGNHKYEFTAGLNTTDLILNE